jgi:hypothetical protein
MGMVLRFPVSLLTKAVVVYQKTTNAFYPSYSTNNLGYFNNPKINLDISLPIIE